jgi:hypothetical protein
MKTFRSMRMRCAALIAGLLLSALNLQALPISSCGFVANVPFMTYNVTANLFGAGKGSCITVTASNITINLNKFVLDGKAGTTIGINISAAATGTQILGFGKIKGFGTGILDLGSSAVLKLLTVVHNKTGVLMNGVTDSSLAGSWILKNSMNGVVLRNTSKCMVGHNAAIAGNGNGTHGYGVWIKNSGSSPLSFSNKVSTNLIQNASYPGTQVAGIWVGSSKTAPLTGCSVGTPSTGNLIENNRVDSNAIVGIGLECGTASSNAVQNNGASLNIFYDGADGTVSCTGDTWTGNAFTTKFRPCD